MKHHIIPHPVGGNQTLINTPNWPGELVPGYYDLNAVRTIQNGGLMYQ